MISRSDRVQNVSVVKEKSPKRSNVPNVRLAGRRENIFATVTPIGVLRY